MKKVMPVFLLLVVFMAFTSFVKPGQVPKAGTFCGGSFYVNNTTAYPIKKLWIESVSPLNAIPISSFSDIPAYTVTSGNGPLLNDYQLAVIVESVPSGGLYFRVKRKPNNILLDCLHVPIGSTATCMSLNDFEFSCATEIEIEVVTTSCGR